jgi:hypothetical protein
LPFIEEKKAYAAAPAAIAIAAATPREKTDAAAISATAVAIDCANRIAPDAIAASSPVFWAAIAPKMVLSATALNPACTVNKIYFAIFPNKVAPCVIKVPNTVSSRAALSDTSYIISCNNLWAILICFEQHFEVLK